MEGLSVITSIERPIELSGAQLYSFNPVSSSEKLSLLEMLMSQDKLSEVLQSFAAWISKHLPICHLSYRWMEQKLEAFHSCHGDYEQTFPLRDQNMQLLGELTYELTEQLDTKQFRILQQLHQILIKPLRLFLRMEEMDQLCRMDHLSGIGNRAYFDEAIHIAIEQNIRNPTGLTLMLLDLDNFKQINDRYGHPVGDQVLQMFSTLLTKIIRGTDMAFRLGGDEFAILFQPADEFTATCVQRRLEDRLKNHLGLQEWNVASSIGFSKWHYGLNAKTLYFNADRELYLHKASKKRV